MIKFFARILQFSGKYKGRIWAAAAFAFIKGICIVMPIFLGFLMFTEFYEKTITIQRCWLYGGALLASVLVNMAANYLSDRMQSAAGYELFADKRIELGSLLKRLPMGYFTSGNIGKISSILSGDMVFVEEIVMQTVADMLSWGFTIIITVAFMFAISWQVGIFVLAITLLVVAIAHFMNKSGVKHGAIRQEQNENLTQAVITHIEGIGIIKSYNLLGEKSVELNQNCKRTKDAALKFEFTQIPWMFVLNILYAIGMVGVLVVAFYLFYNGSMTLPYLIGCVLFCFQIFIPLKSLYGDSARFTVMTSCLNRIEELYNEKPLPDNGMASFPATSAAPEISFENVTFAYEDKDTIKNISFEVQKNTMTALVGPSGGGKTTLSNLLARFWDIKSGSIKIRGVDIKNVPLSELMNQISMVFQNVYLFQDTVFNNIAMGKPNATCQEVEEAAKRARCYDFIMQLPNGFDTVIGEGGASLSGGEKQRISIARCILKDAPIVILDEATASVDLDNERYIQEAISELTKNKTLLVIAHRLNTIRHANKIVVVADGEITETGTHDELMKTNGTYKKFVDIRERN